MCILSGRSYRSRSSARALFLAFLGTYLPILCTAAIWIYDNSFFAWMVAIDLGAFFGSWLYAGTVLERGDARHAGFAALIAPVVAVLVACLTSYVYWWVATGGVES